MDIMLTTRSFRNEDPPRLLELWRKSQAHAYRTRLNPMSTALLQMQTLGPPFFDNRSIVLAFDGPTPVGYVHTVFGPNEDFSNLSDHTTQICFLCVDPTYADPWEVGRRLLRAGEQYLLEQGATEIYGGSPRPSAPFYLGLYGGAEPVAILDSDPYLVQAFLDTGYQVRHKTTRYYLDLTQFVTPMNIVSVEWRSQIKILFHDTPKSKNWWEACSMAHFDWLDTVAILQATEQPIARVRVRIISPDCDHKFEPGSQLQPYRHRCNAGLMDIRVHPDFRHRGLGVFVLGETLRHLAHKRNIALIEAHFDDEFTVLRSLLQHFSWQELEKGTIFFKSLSSTIR